MDDDDQLEEISGKIKEDGIELTILLVNNPSSMNSNPNFSGVSTSMTQIMA